MMQNADDIYGGEYVDPQPEEAAWPSGMHGTVQL